jgi:hypothetical protein
MPKVSLDIGRREKTIVTELDEFARQQAVDGGQLSLRMQELYSLALIDTSRPIRSKEAVVQFEGINPGGKAAGQKKNFAEFFFRVAPKVNEVSEPFATNIIPTQNGGKYVESHGSIIKQIRVQGTTGLRPNKKKPKGVIPLLPGVADVAGINNVIGNINELVDSVTTDPTARKKIPGHETTGHDDIIFLRNIFRLYSDLKADDRLAGRVVMVWRNRKDLDYWVVEPVDFKLVHNASSPMTYEYQIMFKTLSRFDWQFAEKDDPLDAILARRRFLSRLAGFSDQIQRVLSSVANSIDRLDGIGVFAVNSILGPAVALARGVLAIKESVSKFGSRTLRRARELLDNLTDALDKIAGVTETSPSAAGSSSSRFPLQDSLVRDLRRLQVVSARILTEKVIQDTVSAQQTDRRERIVNQYSAPGDSRLGRRLPDTGGSSTFIGNSPNPSSLVEVIIHRGETIRDVAHRCLGERGRWHELAVLNGLRYPYITETGGVDVLKPGDVMMCPADGPVGVDAATININNLSTQNTENQDESRKGPVQQI